MNDLLSASGKILERIDGLGLTLRTLATGTVLLGSADLAPMCPAVFVMSGGASVDENALAHRFIERQQWSVVLCLAAIRDATDTNTTDASAGPYLSSLAKGLAGWRPSAEHQALRYEGRTAMRYEDGIAMYQLNFTTGVPVEAVA